MGRGAWQATVPGVAKSRTRLGDFTSLTAAIIACEVSSGGNPSAQETTAAWGKERPQCPTKTSHRFPAVSLHALGMLLECPAKNPPHPISKKKNVWQHFCYWFLRRVGKKFKGLNSHLLNEIPCGKSHVTLWIKARYLGSEIKNIPCPFKK